MEYTKTCRAFPWSRSLLNFWLFLIAGGCSSTWALSSVSLFGSSWKLKDHRCLWVLICIYFYAVSPLCLTLQSCSIFPLSHSNFLNMTYSFLWGVSTNYYKLGDIKAQKFILSQFWRLEVQNKWVSMIRAPGEASHFLEMLEIIWENHWALRTLPITIFVFSLNLPKYLYIF